MNSNARYLFCFFILGVISVVLLIALGFGGIHTGVRVEDEEPPVTPEGVGEYFTSDMFDNILSFDVLEHVPDDIAALKEVYRCLKPGGTFFFSTPFLTEWAEKQVRARLKPDGSIEHLLPPEIHGNPIDTRKGSLCFRVEGWNLLHDMKNLGFENPRVLCYWSRDFAYLGVEQFLFLARKGCAGKEDAHGI